MSCLRRRRTAGRASRKRFKRTSGVAPQMRWIPGAIQGLGPRSCPASFVLANVESLLQRCVGHMTYLLSARCSNPDVRSIRLNKRPRSCISAKTAGLQRAFQRSSGAASSMRLRSRLGEAAHGDELRLATHRERAAQHMGMLSQACCD